VGLLDAVVDPAEHHVLDEDPAVSPLVVLAAGGEDLGERVALVHRHQLGSQRVVGRVQRAGEADRALLLGEPHDARHPADRRDRRAAVRDADVGQALARLEHGVEVHHRLAHPHEDEVVHVLDAAEVERLVEDLRGGEVAPEAHLTRRAEAAGERAPRLRAHADRAAPVAIAHQHRLQRPPIRGLQERLARPVVGGGLVPHRQGRERHRRGQPLAQLRGQVRHLLVGARAARRPLPHLPRAERRLAGLGERAVEQLEVHAAECRNASAAPLRSCPAACRRCRA